MAAMLVHSVVLLLAMATLGAEGFRILGICPSTSYSHQQPFQALMKALARRGHKMTVISPVPLKVSCPFITVCSRVRTYTSALDIFGMTFGNCSRLRCFSSDACARGFGLLGTE